MTAIFETPAPRLKEVLHYVIARTQGRGFGRIKLNKVVVRADIEHYRRYGTTISGAESFQKQKFGPVPNGVIKSLNLIIDGGLVARRAVATGDWEREEYALLKEPSVDRFKSTEIDVLNIAISHLDRLSAKRASDETHDALWDEIELFGQIPVRAAAFKPTIVDQESLAWALEEGRS